MASDLERRLRSRLIDDARRDAPDLAEALSERPEAPT
ncbi:hypothetical protein FHS53_000498 [Xanthobacter tagetidis]|nr:hypothetical protein [Xanthobacter tagetidis]